MTNFIGLIDFVRDFYRHSLSRLHPTGPLDRHAQLDGAPCLVKIGIYSVRDRESMPDLDDAFDLYDAGDLAGAVDACQSILAASSEDFGALYLLGSLYGELGRNADAVAMLQRATRANPDKLIARFNLARIQFDLGQFEEALSGIDMFLDNTPQDVEALALKASICARLKRIDEAIALNNEAIRIDPHFAAALVNQAKLLIECGRHTDAEQFAERAIALNPDLPEAYCNRGLALSKLGQIDSALEDFAHAIELNPDYAAAYSGRAVALLEKERSEDALRDLDLAIALMPDDPETLICRGAAYAELGRYKEAFRDTDAAITLQPDNAMAHMNKGTFLAARHDFENAKFAYEKAISLDPDLADARYNRAMLLLRLGNFKEGLKEYEWRKRIKHAVGNLTYERPVWTGEEDLRGKRILVHDEQGLGDTIQFCRYLPLLMSRGAIVLFAVKPVLKALMLDGEPRLQIVDLDIAERHFDFHIPLLSLPLAMGTQLEDVPASIPYLRAQESRVTAWRERLGQEGFKIGICWQGSRNKVDKGRSFPVRHFADLSQIADVRLISLQKGFGEEQLDNLPLGMKVERPGTDFDNGPDAFVDAAAVIACCDLIITSDTAIAHLAGALGARTWLALKHVPDWRWMIERADSPWYPTMRLFRQKADGDWAGVFADIRQALANILNHET